MTAPRPAEEPDVARMKRDFHSTLIAVSKRLEEPYSDDPRWSPWTRFVRPMIARVDAGIDALLSRLAAVERERDEDRAKLETVTVQLQQCIDERNYRIKERVAAEAREAELRARLGSVADEIRAQKEPCSEHPPPFPKPSCWQCGRNGAFERAARIVAAVPSEVTS